MRVAISRSLLEAISADALEEPGRERCGLLLGSVAAITGFTPARNVHPEPERHFEIDPAVLIAAHKAMRSDISPGLLTAIGHYHSHPVGRAVPSAKDADNALIQQQYWMIVTARQVTLWLSRDGGAHLGRFDPVTLEVIADDALAQGQRAP